MKSSLILLLILCYSLTVKSQVKPIYFIGDSVVTDKTKATNYGVFGKLSTENLYVLKLYDLYDNLVQTGFYKDEKLAIPHGKFLIYNSVDEFNYENNTTYYLKDTDRFLYEQGEYIDGKKEGRWVQFSPDGKIFTITNYIKGLKHGEFKQFNRRGKLVAHGSYKLDVKDGEWIYDRLGKEIYTNGILTYKSAN